MYLKNTSPSACIVINTVRGKVGIKPQEVVDIQYKILPPVSRSLIQVNKEEYLSFREKTTGTIEALIEAEDKSLQQPETVVEEEKLDELERVEDEVVEIQDTGVMGFVNSLLEKKNEVVEETEALIVNETDSANEADEIEQRIEDLKLKWQSAKQVSKKSKYAKEIKELQKQLKKIK